MSERDDTERRPIRSFVLRQGRMSEAQRRAHRDLFPVWGIPFTGAPLDLDAAFGRTAPRILEIGSGMGDATVEIAAANRDVDYLAIEVHAPGVGALLRRITELGLTNVRVLQHDAVEVVERMVRAGSFDGVHVFFPDPWPKKRHHKRRLLQPGFVHALARCLRAGGYLHVATDWPDYAESALAVLAAEPLLENETADYAPRPRWRPLTKFERRGIDLGHPVYDLIFRRRPFSADRDASSVAA